MFLTLGKGYSSGCFAKYCLSNSAVFSFSLYVPLSCLLTPTTLIMPCSASIWLRGIISSSYPSMPVSERMRNIVLILFELLLIMASTFSVFGISGIGEVRL